MTGYVLTRGEGCNMVGYTNSLEHLQEELRRMDLLVHLQVLRFRMQRHSPWDAFKGLYIAEDEIDASLQEEASAGVESGSENAQLTGLLEQLTALEAQIAARKAASRQAGIGLRLEQLRALCQLSPFEVDALLICLAPALDLKYEKFYAYLQDDVTRKHPSVSLILDLLCPSGEEKFVARRSFAPTAPLLAIPLLMLIETTPPPSLLTTALQVDARITEYLLGSDQCDARLLPGVVYWSAPAMPWHRLVLPEDLQDRLQRLGSWYAETRAQTAPAHEHTASLILYFQGRAGAGKQTTAATFCQALGLPLLVVDVARLLRCALPDESAVRLLFREAMLQQTALYFEGFDLLLGDDERLRSYGSRVIEELAHFSGVTILAGQAAWEPMTTLHHQVFIRIEFSALSYNLRRQVWEAALHGQAPEHLDVGALASKFRLGPGHIQDAIAMARNLALWRDPDSSYLTVHDLQAACRAHAPQQVSTLARQVQGRFSWDDLVLPAEPMAQLRDVVHAVQYRHRVYGDWGFERKLALGKGLNVLFSGPSGTGKTMAASIMAGELGLDLYKINLSMVVSKYIGETEKNLDRIFQEAQEANAILFFDEADALFGKRSEVKDAHDRYANIEIAYLLQKMEEYEGVVVLTTNLRKNMDEAFVRRMHATIEFPFPEEESRRQIWAGIFPTQAPLSPEVDWDFLARQFKLSGGNIKNIALHAAFLAAEEDAVIGMAHLMQATRRELHKMGRLINRADFMAYADLVQV